MSRGFERISRHILCLVAVACLAAVDSAQAQSKWTGGTGIVWADPTSTRIGIGTNAPASNLQLHITGAAAGGTRVGLQNTVSGGTTWEIISGGGTDVPINNFALRQGTTNRLLITNAGAATLNGTLGVTGATTLSSTLGVTGVQTNAADLVFSGANGIIRSNTADASDNKRLVFGGGGATDPNRGGHLVLYGNEFTGVPGDAQLIAGVGITGSAGSVRLKYGASSADGLVVNGVGQVSIPGLSGTGTRIVTTTSTGALGSTSFSFTGLANPTATIGLTATNGTATTAMRSDAAPALNVGISPEWTGDHTFQKRISFSGFGTSMTGSMVRTAADGLLLRGVNGSANDFALFSANGTMLMRNPVGTNNLTINSSLTMQGNAALFSTAANQIVFTNSSNNLVSSSNLAFDGSNVGITGGLNVSGSTSLGGSLTAYDIRFGNNRTSYLTATATPAIYGTNEGGGAWPFNWNNHLVIQGRSDAARDILFVTGVTPTLRYQISGAGDHVFTGAATFSAGLGVSGLITANTGISLPDGQGVTSTIGFPRGMVSRSGTTLSVGDKDGWTGMNFLAQSGSMAWKFGAAATTYMSLTPSLFNVTVPATFGGSLAVNGDLNLNSSLTTQSIQFGNSRSSYFSGSVSPAIYGTNDGGGAWPFNWNNNLIIQGRSDAARDILFVTGTTPALRYQISGGGDHVFHGPMKALEGIEISGGGTAEGKIYRNPTDGLIIRGWNGSENSLALYSSDQGTLLRNPRNSRDLFLGNGSGMTTFPGTVTFNGAMTLPSGAFNIPGHATVGNRLIVTGEEVGQEVLIVKQNTAAGAIAHFRNPSGTKVVINHAGNVGVGIIEPFEKLEVDGNIKTTGEIIAGTIRATKWKISQAPDYVFERDYKLSSLEKIEAFVKKNKHLPDIPSAREMKKSGLDLVQMNFDLLKKVEELTLYAIEQNKRTIEQEQRSRDLEKEIKNLKITLSSLSKNQ